MSKKRLKMTSLDEVSFVTQGANPLSHIGIEKAVGERTRKGMRDGFGQNVDVSLYSLFHGAKDRGEVGEQLASYTEILNKVLRAGQMISKNASEHGAKDLLPTEGWIAKSLKDGLTDGEILQLVKEDAMSKEEKSLEDVKKELEASLKKNAELEEKLKKAEEKAKVEKAKEEKAEKAKDDKPETYFSKSLNLTGNTPTEIALIKKMEKDEFDRKVEKHLPTVSHLPGGEKMQKRLIEAALSLDTPEEVEKELKALAEEDKEVAKMFSQSGAPVKVDKTKSNAHAEFRKLTQEKIKDGMDPILARSTVRRERPDLAAAISDFQGEAAA